jgi:Family of unknown function (DUF5343)
MASYPYTSGQGALAQALTQLQKNFPAKVDADYLKRFAIAPSNESYIIAIVRFLNLLTRTARDWTTTLNYSTERRRRLSPV